MSAAVVAGRLALLRAALDGVNAGALRLRGAGWFAWATAGADAAPGPASDCGAAQLLVTRDEACILTDETAADRLRAGPLPDGFTFHIAPWTEPELHEPYVLGAAAERAVLADRPGPGELPLPASLRARRAALDAGDQARLRALGRDTAAAAGEALRTARPEWTQRELAGACAHALWRRGIVPALLLVNGDAFPTDAPLGRRAVLQAAGRRHGLHALLARGVAFGPHASSTLTDDERNAHAALLQVEATGLDAIRPGRSLAAVYHALDAGYRHANLPEAIRAGSQGGVTGYALHELTATPSSATGIEPGMAFALAPAIGGERVADTFVLGAAGLEPVTVDPSWPAQAVAGRQRPLWLEVT